MPVATACSRIAPAIITSVCGVLNDHARFASTGSMIRTDDASEITGVCASANTSSIAREFGVVVEPMIASTFDSPISLRVFCTAVVVSDASSSTMYSTVLPATSFAHMPTVLRSGMPSDAAGPVAETVTPIRTCAAAVAANAHAKNATLRVSNCFMASPCELVRRRRCGGRRHDKRVGGASADGNGQREKSPEPRASAACWRSIEGVIGKACEKTPDRDATLEPREIEARARMDTEPERQVTVRRASDVEHVGVRELFRIAVRSADAERHARPCGQIDVTDACWLRRDPVPELIRAVEAKEFLDGDFDQRRVAQKALALERPLRQCMERVADQVRRRLMAGVQQEDALMNELGLGQALAVGVTFEKPRQHVGVGITRMRAARVDQRAQVRGHLDDGAVPGSGTLGCQDGLQRAKDRERPAPQRLALVARHAEQVADDLNGNRARERIDQIDVSLRGDS